MRQSEFDALMADESKRIENDITWTEDEDHSPAVEFRAEVRADTAYPLFVRGSYNPEARALTFALIHRAVGRIYALDLGKEHHNPSCEYVGETHKHAWDETARDKHAYVPPDITETLPNVIAIWRQFCNEAKIAHRGRMHPPPARQQELFP